MKTPRILVCTATSFEQRAVLRGLRASSAPEAFEVLHTGMGFAAATLGLTRRLENKALPPVTHVVSTGIAGGLGEPLGVGVRVNGTRITRAGCETLPAANTFAGPLRRAGLQMVDCAYLTVDGIVSQLPAGLEPPLVADMESYAWAFVARGYELPFDALRVISDTPRLPLPGWVVAMTASTQPGPWRRRVGGAFRGIARAAAAPAEVATGTRRLRSALRQLTYLWEVLASIDEFESFANTRDVQAAAKADQGSRGFATSGDNSTTSQPMRTPAWS